MDWTDTGYEPGRRARAAILAELRRGENAGEDAPTLRELARAVGLSLTTTARNVTVLRRVGTTRGARTEAPESYPTHTPV